MDMDGLRRFRKTAEETPAKKPAKVTGDSDENSDPIIEESSDSSEYESPVKGIQRHTLTQTQTHTHTHSHTHAHTHTPAATAAPLAVGAAQVVIFVQ